LKKRLKKLVQVIAAVASVSLVFMASSCGGRQNLTVIVAGSTSVQPFAELLAEEYAHERPEIEIDVQGGGSSAGITAVISGTADIGMSSRMLKGDELELWSVEIAKDGLAIIVHPGNPLDNLSEDQLRGIYTGSIQNWMEVGGADARIHIISREEGSGTRSAFEDLIMESEYISPKAIVQDSNGAVRQLVSGDRNSIGFISLGLVDDTVKALRLRGIDPTWANISNGSYSLYRPFLFVTREEPAGSVKQFISFALSDEGRRMLTEEGLIPPDNGVQ